MKTERFIKATIIPLLVFGLTFGSCMKNTAPPPDEPSQPDSDMETLLINQIDNLIIPTASTYLNAITELETVAQRFSNEMDIPSLEALRSQYFATNLAYQSAAVHNYFATANLDIVNTTNLYPIDVTLLEEFIENESYDFNSINQQRANGFPALDYLLYGLQDPKASFSSSAKMRTFLMELIAAMKEKADFNVVNWTGDLRDNFVNNGGVALGSSISVQLNEIMFYYEEHVRENKVGIPIGRLGPNDTPIEPDVAKKEALYQSLFENSDAAALAMVRAAVEEMEDIYLGNGNTSEGFGYDDLLMGIDQDVLDEDIRNQFREIYTQIDNRTSITGDDDLYNSIQGLVTLYKSDLFPVLNVQDADGSNDGD